MAATSLPTTLTNIRTLLKARAGLSGVNVFTGPVPPKSAGKECIELGNEVEIGLTHQAMASTKLEEEYDIPCIVTVYRPIKPGVATALEDTIAAARTRAEAIMAEVTACLSVNTTASGAVLDCFNSSQTWIQGYAPESPELGRFCSVEFSIHVVATVTP